IEKALAHGGLDSGTSARVFASILTWMQEKTAPVFVVATANQNANLPPELLRKGRFDEIFFLDLPTAAERTETLTGHLQERRRRARRRHRGRRRYARHEHEEPAMRYLSNDPDLESAFLHEIAACPGDETPVQVYADWLTDQADEASVTRGEYLRLESILRHGR